MPLSQPGFIDTQDGRVETRWIEPSGADRNGNAVVLLHEGLGCVGMWRDFPERLGRRTGHGVFAYSRLGYGNSDPCTLPRPLNYMQHEGQAILPRILDAIEVDHLVLVGHSDGASIAAIHAGSRPDPRLRALVLMAPHFFAEQVSIDSIAEAKQAFEEGNLRQRLARHHGKNVDCAFRGWNDAWLDPDFRRWDLTGFLPHIEVPVLFIQGREDQYGSLAQLETLKTHLRTQLTSVVLENCRHAPQGDQPQPTLDAIAEFIEHTIR